MAVLFGDGDIHGNTLLARTLLFLSYLIKTHFGKAVITVNHSADFSDPDLLRVAQEVYIHSSTTWSSATTSHASVAGRSAPGGRRRHGVLVQAGASADLEARG